MLARVSASLKVLPEGLALKKQSLQIEHTGQHPTSAP